MNSGQPFKNLVADLASAMLAIDPAFEVQPAVNKTISRIFRDTRFSRDKSLFRGNMWLVFKRPSKDWKIAPAFFFELFPDCYRYGIGYCKAPREIMDKFREKIEKNPAIFLKTISFFKTQNLFELMGEDFKRKLPNNLPEEMQPWYQKKSFYLICNRHDDLVLSAQLVEELICAFNLLQPLYQYLMTLHGAPN